MTTSDAIRQSFLPQPRIKTLKYGVDIKQKPKRFRVRVRRHRFTLNNPFIDEVTVVDVNNLTAEQQKIFVKNHHDFAYIKQPQVSL